MAKGNDGNYLQHCVEVEAAVRLAQASPDGRLYIALTHGMEPFEQISEPNGNAYHILHVALREAAGEPKYNEREIVKAYRASWMSQAYQPDITNLFDELRMEKHYPNSAELLRMVIGTDQLSAVSQKRTKPSTRNLRRYGPIRKSLSSDHHGVHNWVGQARWTARTIWMCPGYFLWTR